MTTKIIATVGLKSEEPALLKALLKEGVDLVRVNFSHATYDQYKRIKKVVGEFNKNSERKTFLLQDLQGPRIRVGHLPEKGVILHDNELVRFAFCRTGKTLEEGIIPIDNSELHIDIKKNDPLFLCNGEIELIVTEIKNKIIYAKVLRGGLVTSHKGVNIPSTKLKRGGLTPKDIQDVKFALKTGVDYIALSFVQTAQDVARLRKIIGKHKKVRIISKIERALALKNIDSIINASDVIMIARGDLGIEIPIEDLPIVQKNLVRHAHWHDKPTIIATQVMTSMIKNPHPTRAEISDIANAVLDGADMIMLSDETTIGVYPKEAVKILRRVINRIESYLHKENVVF
ncbi:MAG: pyruvate kinase [Patescibacteria group bacterium]|jgi:pyruvate kinase